MEAAMVVGKRCSCGSNGDVGTALLKYVGAAFVGARLAHSVTAPRIIELERSRAILEDAARRSSEVVSASARRFVPFTSARAVAAAAGITPPN
jgi:hypothetical protein